MPTDLLRTALLPMTAVMLVWTASGVAGCDNNTPRDMSQDAPSGDTDQDSVVDIEEAGDTPDLAEMVDANSQGSDVADADVMDGHVTDASDAADGSDVAQDMNLGPVCDDCNFCLDSDFCQQSAMPIGVGTLSMQNTAVGAWGDCARSASGVGGRNLYYRVTVPPGRWLDVVAAPNIPMQDAMVRFLNTCHDDQCDYSGRGGLVTNGAAPLCMQNESTQPRTVIVAVGRYSGESNDETLSFDLTVAIRDSASECTTL